IWYCQDCNYINCSCKDIKNCQKCMSVNIKRDPDVLDTWFSSALWAFSVFDREQDFKYYFPSNVLITGSDILFFWVARMIMMTAEVHKVISFKEVFLHGIVRDKEGIKMSKTLGNGIDPLSIINEHSADILRFTMMYNTNLGMDTNIGSDSFQLGKVFCTKLWNSVRYVMMKMEENTDNKIVFKSNYNLKIATQIDIWILNKLNLLIESYNKSLDNYDFGDVARKLYSFVWNDFCNCYLECAKAVIDNSNTKYILLKIIDTLLLLLHPFIPFLTEELFQMIKIYFVDLQQVKSIMTREFPKAFEIAFADDENQLFEIHKDIVKIIRNTKATFEIYKHDPIPLIIITDNDKLKKYIQGTFIYIEKMCGISEITFDLIDNAKYIIEKQNGYTLYFPVNEKYKVGGIIGKLESSIKHHNEKIQKIKEKMNNIESKKKKGKFEQNIKTIQNEISKLEAEIGYYNELIKDL
ncbi:MAG: class I tRNA ligase family protein, partial [Nitrososphaeraceae archaeon]|nr:class I tRNA ligase family protein [Nitrososphaeraceae archaeon]